MPASDAHQHHCTIITKLYKISTLSLLFDLVHSSTHHTAPTALLALARSTRTTFVAQIAPMRFVRVDVTLLTILVRAHACVGLLAADPTLDRFHMVRRPARVASLTVLLVVGANCSWKSVNLRAFPDSVAVSTSEKPVHSHHTVVASIAMFETSEHRGVAELIGLR
jgi:hypothetical protein